MIERLRLRTSQRSEFIDITEQVERSLSKLGARSGLCVVFVPHTTAGVTLNEHCDRDVPHDMLLTFDRLAPRDPPGYRHDEGDSDAHVKASLVGASVTVFVESERLVLGTWQGIFFCEFDGPRDRRVLIKFLADADQ